MIVLSSLAGNSNHLFSFPFLLPLSFSSLSSHVPFEFIKLAYIFFPCFPFLEFCDLLPHSVFPTCLGSMLLVFLFARSLSPFFVLQIPAAAQPGPRAQPCGLWDCGERSSCCQHPCHCSQRPEARFVYDYFPPVFHPLIVSLFLNYYIPLSI